MYLELFKLHELPFRLSPDPQFLYLSKQHARAKAYMESTIWFTDGFVVITGEIGAGKTTLIETFLRELEPEVVVAQINQTQLSPTAFLQTVLVQFGFTPFDMKKPEVLATLNQFLTEQHVAGRKVVLIIDEAQNLSYKVLEEIRMLSGIETTKEKVMRIILAGQPELNDKLNSRDLIQLVQRVRLRFHLSALSNAETISYIDHRLEVAGAEGRRIFAEDTYPTIYRYTGGVPRLVNTLCDTAMMSAFGRESDVVTEEDITAALRELQWVEFNARTNRMQSLQMDGALGRPGNRTDGRPHFARERRRHRSRARAQAGQARHRPHPGQRPADRQQIHQPSSLPDRDSAGLVRDRGLEQHQRHFREIKARAPAQSQRRRCRGRRPARDHVHRRASAAQSPLPRDGGAGIR